MLDILSIMSGEDHKVNEKITVKHPTLKEIREYGETEYYGLVSLFCTKPYDFMVQLDDIGIDYEDLDNYDMFLIMFNMEDSNKHLKWLIGCDDFKIVTSEQNSETVLYSETYDIIIDRLSFQQISEFLEKINSLDTRQRFKAAGGMTKKFLIDQERRKQKRLKNRPKKNESYLGKISNKLIWATNGTMYEKVWDLPIYLIHSGLKEIQKTKDYDHIMSGIYAGNVDTKKINMENIHWLN